MAAMWTLKASRPGVTDEIQFVSEAEALAYVDRNYKELQDATVFLVDDNGKSRILVNEGERADSAAA